MKRFAKITENPLGFTTVNVLTQVVTSPGNQQGLSLVQIRERIKILDAVEAEGDHVVLGDREHEALCKLLNDHPWGTAHRDLLAVIDGVLGAELAKEPSRVHVKEPHQTGE